LFVEKAAASPVDAQKKSLRAAEQDRADVAEAREKWRAPQPHQKPEQLVFIDKILAKTNMARGYGRAPRGQRLVAPVPHGHWKTTTFIAALRRDEITAPCVFDGPMNGASFLASSRGSRNRSSCGTATPRWLETPRFLAYVEQFLVPTLRSGDLVVMDILGSHNVAGVCEAIERAGAMPLYLPAYSPDLNPIEQAFANSPPAFPTSVACWNLKPASLKAALRKAAATEARLLPAAGRSAISIRLCFAVLAF
jgi:hypothetical protein